MTPTISDSNADAQRHLARTLVWHAALLSVLGLVSGFTTLFAKAPSAALSAHSIGLLEGAVLFGLAGAWRLIGVSGRKALIIKWTLLSGFYANWLGAQLASLWSARQMFVVSGTAMPGGAAPWMEWIVAVLLNLSVLAFVAFALILWQARAQR